MVLLLVALSVCGAALWLYVTSLDSDITETLVSQGELVSDQPRVYTVQCSEDYENYKRYPGEALVSARHSVRLSADSFWCFKQCFKNYIQTIPSEVWKGFTASQHRIH